MGLAISDSKNSRVKKSLMSIYKILTTAYRMNTLEFALLSVLRNMLKINMNSISSSMITGKVHIRQYHIRQKPKQDPQSSVLLLRIIRNINGLALPICKIGLQMQY